MDDQRMGEVWCSMCDQPATVERGEPGNRHSYCAVHDPERGPLAPRPGRPIPAAITDPWLRRQWAETVRR